VRFRLIVTGLTVVAVVGFGLVTTASAASSLSSKSPAAILSLAIQSIKDAGSFHYAQTASVSGSVEVTLSTDSSPSEGTQTQTLDGGTETTRLIGTTLYIKGDKTAYAQDFGVKITTLANEWVLVPKSNKNYVDIATAILTSSVVQQDAGFIPQKDLGLKIVNGKRAVAIEGAVKSSSVGAGTQTMYVSTAAPYRPIGLAVKGTIDGRKITSDVLFSKWGEKFTVTKPATFVTATAKTFP
jgi:hypothetical protein